MPDGPVLALLGAAALLAGWVDAVVGGGGLIQLPALVLGLPGATPAQLLATNKLGSICGTSVSAMTYYRRIRPDLRTALPMAAAAYVGSIGGAVVGLHIPKAAVNPLILVMLLLVGAYTLARPEVGAQTRLRHAGARHTSYAVLVGVVIGAYDGALGPGTGSFFVFALAGWLGFAFLHASAKAKIANFATNLGALTVFVPQGQVLWSVGLLMGALNLVGGYLGARTAVRLGSGFVRSVFVVVVGAFVVRIGGSVLGVWP